MQIRAPEAPREARRLRRPHLQRGAPIFADFEPRRRPFGPSGELRQRAPGLDFEARANFDQIVRRRNRCGS
eukprot:15484840-Alexandrium_andersonii.AAC.1